MKPDAEYNAMEMYYRCQEALSILNMAIRTGRNHRDYIDESVYHQTLYNMSIIEFEAAKGLIDRAMKRTDEMLNRMYDKKGS